MNSPDDSIPSTGTSGSIPDLFWESGARLSQTGRLVMVANAFLNYLPRLREHYPIVKMLDQNSRYRIFEARKT